MPIIHCEGINLSKLYGCFAKSLLNGWSKQFKLSTRCQLRDNATESLVGDRLGQDHIRHYIMAVADNGDRSIIACSLDSQDNHGSPLWCVLGNGHG